MTVIDLTLRMYCDELKDHMKKAGFHHFRNAVRKDGHIQIEILTDEGWCEVRTKIEDSVKGKNDNKVA